MIGVLTTDIVGSTKLSATDLRQTLSSLEQHLADLQSRHKLIYALYRGDEFQLAIDNPLQAAGLMLQLKLWLAGGHATPALACTASLAIGPGRLEGSDPGKANGQTYVASGRGLESTKRGQFDIQVLGISDPALPLLCQQLSFVLNRLTRNQAALLYTYLNEEFPTHQQLANQLETSRQNISDRLRACGAELLEPFLDYIAQRIEQADGL